MMFNRTLMGTGRASLLSFLIIAAGVLAYLARDLPDTDTPAFHFHAPDFTFVLGSGQPEAQRMIIDQFENGTALLSSGPVNIHAKNLSALRYNWQVSRYRQEATFFWRRKGDNISKTEIYVSGTHIIDLSTLPDWHGEIVELGFVVGDETMAIGPMALEPDSLKLRLQMLWQGWTTFEEWSQHSVHFLEGGDYNQAIPLPPLVIAWLILAIILLWLGTRFKGSGNPKQVFVSMILLSLLAWIILDVRWASNNLKQTRLSLEMRWQEQERSSSILDGEIFEYVQKLKSDVLGEKNARILIIGDWHTIDYYMLRAKYHLLPHSADVARYFSRGLDPASLDYVIFFGQANDIIKVPGWGSSWRNSLLEVNRNDGKVVYRVK